jgi:ribonuclease P/MRP protein subunit RPP1
MANRPQYEAIHAYPDGDATVARAALTASEYGYDGVVVRNHADERADYDATTIRETYDVDVVEGVEIVADDPSRASGYLGGHRPEHTIVAVHGGTDAMNRFAVEQPAVDVLAHPTAGGAEPDQVLARTAANHGVRLEVCLSPLFDDAGGSRVRSITDLRRLWTLIDQYDVPYVLTVGANSHLDIRAPRDLAGLATSIGLDVDDVRTGLAAWERLATRNRTRRSEGFVEPGVSREE